MSFNFTAGRFKAWASDGSPLASGRLYTYSSGTTTFKAAYTDSTLGTPCTYVNDGSGGLYIALDARGEADVWWGSGAYSFKLTDAAGLVIDTGDGQQDPIDSVLSDLSSTSGGKGSSLVYGARKCVRTSDYATLELAVAAVGVSSKTLVVDSATSCTSNLAIPSNISIAFDNPGFITITGSKTLTINGSFEAGARQVFSTPTVTKATKLPSVVLATITNNVIFGGTSRPVVNPRWFGAGGGSDDWDALQGALWCVTQASPGITVQLEPRTTYTISKSPVIDTNYFRLIGAPGAKIVRKNAAAGDYMNLLDTGHEGRYTWGPSYPITGVEVMFVEFDGNKANNTVGVDDTYDDGLSLLYLKSSKIIGNVVRNCLRFGIAVSNSNDVIVKGNMVYDCDENGLYAETGSKIVFSGNVVDNCSTVTYNMGNISMSNIVGGAITGNISRNGYDGIYIRNVCDGVTVSGNSVVSPTRYGIWVKDETDSFGTIPVNTVITGNTVKMSGSYACHLEITRKTSVTGNNFNTNGAAYALSFRNGEDQTIAGNVYTGYATAPVQDVGGNSRTFLSDVSGTYMPVIQGASSAGAGTYSVQTGRHTRTGNRCQVYAVTTQSAHTGTGQARITLPFTAHASDASVLTINVYNASYTGQIIALVVGGQAYANLWQNNNGTLSAFNVPAGGMTCTITGSFEV